jgi:hypothetical protein
VFWGFTSRCQSTNRVEPSIGQTVEDVADEGEGLTMVESATK